MSQKALALEVGVSKQAISKYELGKDMPSSGVLTQLARALGVRVEFFLRPKPVAKVEAPAFRKHSRLSVREKNAIVAKLQEWLERCLEVESFFPPEELRRFEFPLRVNRSVGSLEDAERVAEGLRGAWDLGVDPIENLTEVLEDKGLKVGLVDAPKHFDALTFWVNHDAPVVSVNRTFPGDRQRFSLAHELGHLMLEPTRGVDEEKAANRFAGAFLVPAAVARYELGKRRHALDPRELYLLKHKFGLSMLGWVRRAEDLGIVSGSAAKSLYKLFNSRGWRRHEPGEQLPPERPTRMKRLVMKILVEGLISESRAAELLGNPLREFHGQAMGKYDGLPVGAGN